MKTSLSIMLLVIFGLFSPTFAQDKTQTGTGKIIFCKEVDDNWNPVGESTVFKPNEPFNVFMQLPTACQTDFIGFIIHTRDASGKDIGFVDEYMMSVEEKNTKFATTEGFRLPAGTYTVYVIKWRNREINFHNGNFKEYYAKGFIDVK